MAIPTITNAYVSVNGVDLSDHVTSVTVNDGRAKIDITTMGSTSNVYQKGLGDAKITVGFLNDWAAAKVHATLSPLIASTTPFTVEARAVNAARSATNPAFLLSGALLFNYDGLDAKVGDAPAFTADFENAAGTGITYPTS